MMEEFFTEEKSNKELKQEAQINEYEYSEEKVFDFSPKLLKKAKGAHTLNSNNGLIVSDCYSFDS